MRKAGATAYRILTWLFLAGVLAQVFLAGLVVVAGTSSWESHIGLGHGLGLPLILMVATMYLGGLPRTTKRLTLLLLFIYILHQADVVIFLRDSAPYLAALHPVMALLDFAIGWRLARRTYPSEKDPARPEGPSSTAAAVGDK